jgi:hypothetical protein
MRDLQTVPSPPPQAVTGIKSMSESLQNCDCLCKVSLHLWSWPCSQCESYYYVGNIVVSFSVCNKEEQTSVILFLWAKGVQGAETYTTFVCSVWGQCSISENPIWLDKKCISKTGQVRVMQNAQDSLYINQWWEPGRCHSHNSQGSAYQPWVVHSLYQAPDNSVNRYCIAICSSHLGCLSQWILQSRWLLLIFMFGSLNEALKDWQFAVKDTVYSLAQNQKPTIMMSFRNLLTNGQSVEKQRDYVKK